MNPAPALRVVAVASGKGGVGKSTVSLYLALGLRDAGHAVGLLDADLYGPDIPLMIGLTRVRPAQHWDVWRGGGAVELEPVDVLGLQLMSVGFLIGEEQSLALPAPSIVAILRQLVGDVRWRSLDYLVIDLPPGTADVQQALSSFVELDGTIVVVGPQDASHLDAKRLLDMLRYGGVAILGGVENMSGLDCPHCGGAIEIFSRVQHDRSIWALGVRHLARIPIKSRLVPADFSQLVEAVRLALPVDGDPVEEGR